MEKIIIPTIIAATVLLAGMFAFMPVEQATAVHTTIQGTQMNQVSSIAVTAVDAEIDCTSDAAFIVHYIVGGLTTDADTAFITVGAGVVTFTYNTDAAGQGFDGVTGSIMGDAGDTILVDSSRAGADGIVSLVTTSGATASCED